MYHDYNVVDNIKLSEKKKIAVQKALDKEDLKIKSFFTKIFN